MELKKIILVKINNYEFYEFEWIEGGFGKNWNHIIGQNS